MWFNLPVDPSPLSIVLLSGGLDSAVTASVAARDSAAVQGRGAVALLHVNYGQRTETRELRSFTEIADGMDVGSELRLVVDISHLAEIGGSALTDKTIDVPPGDLTVPEGPAGPVPITYVPFRNAHLLSIAVSWAEVIGASSIYIGAVEEDSSGYPDCRKEFFTSFEETVRLGTKPETTIEIKTPLIDLRKSDIVRLGVELGSPFHLTWSCYRGSRLACGECDSCLLRLRGFEEAGVKDPIPYAGRADGI